MTVEQIPQRRDSASLSEEWVGRQESRIETIEQWPLNALNSLIEGRSSSSALDPETAARACCHWMYFVPAVSQSQIDIDGHPKRGDFIPALPQARRMWAKSVITYQGDLAVGQQVRKTSTISSIESKSGKSGELVFLNIANKYSQGDTVLREEEQTLVYRDHQDYNDDVFTLKANANPEWSFPEQLSTVELFRFSAATYNAHRIHYDADYTRDVEKYPAVIVQGQFIATLVLTYALAAADADRCKHFTFKAVKPLFVNRPCFIEGIRVDENKIEAWAREPDGRVNMLAEIIL